MERCWKTLAQMKDFLLIDNKLLNQFWAKAIDTANYLQNWLPTMRTANSLRIVTIPEEAWIEVKQNLDHI